MSLHQIPIKSFIRIRSKGKSFMHTTNTIKIISEHNKEAEYVFDKIFSSSTTQQILFKNMIDLINKFREGFNCTIFCYGNTGAGKTHTMVGTETDPGLVFNIVKYLLEYDQINISFIEIYNEKIFDLFEPKELFLREFENKIVISSLKTFSIKSFEEFKKVFSAGNINRKTAETNLNKTSSRSHSILQISLNGAKLYLIDLAGSENNKKTGNKGLRMTESSNINKSLFVLGNVVNAILNKNIRIPYRDSKLTRLLQDSLGGSSLCYIIANIIDEWGFLDETISTLKFAAKSRKIVNIGSAMTSIVKHSSFKPNKRLTNNLALTDKTNTPKKKKKKEDSTFILKSSMYDKSEILLTPNTQEKSYKAFLKRAQDYENEGNYKKALDDYKTLKKIRDNEDIQKKIDQINIKLKNKKGTKSKITKRDVLDILNSGNFIQIKKLSGVGDKRAQSIVDFINGGNFFETLEDLKLLFSDKIISSILTSIDV